jgi:hypothetical protein
MTFYYHQPLPVAQTQISFRVFLSKPGGQSWNKLIFQISQTSDQWTKYSVTIGNLPAGYQIQIEGMGVTTQETSPYADMEIDNIQFENCGTRNFSSAELDCSFENGNCGWTEVDLSTNSKLNWVL